MTGSAEVGQPSRPRRGRPPSGGREALLVAAVEVLTERGASRLTTREVALRAGVSEGTLFYHFTDRTGLLTAVIEDGLEALRPVNDRGLEAGDPAAALSMFAHAVEGFLERALVVMIAAQSDAELREALSAYLQKNDMGPHVGIKLLADHLLAEQEQGRIRPDADVEAIAYFIYSACFQRVTQRQMISSTYGQALPSADRLTSAMAALLAPTGSIGPDDAPESDEGLPEG